MTWMWLATWGIYSWSTQQTLADVTNRFLQSVSENKDTCDTPTIVFYETRISYKELCDEIEALFDMMGLLPTVFGVETMGDELWILVILEWPHLRTPAQGEGPWGPHPPDSSNSCPSNVWTCWHLQRTQALNALPSPHLLNWSWHPWERNRRFWGSCILVEWLLWPTAESLRKETCEESTDYPRGLIKNDYISKIAAETSVLWWKLAKGTISAWILQKKCTVHALETQVFHGRETETCGGRQQCIIPDSRRGSLKYIAFGFWPGKGSMTHACPDSSCTVWEYLSTWGSPKWLTCL